MNAHSAPLRWPLLLLTAAVFAGPLQAAPRDEVLRLVPDDVGLCLLIQDLRGHTAELADAPFARQLRATVLGKMVVASPEVQQLADVNKVLKEHLGTSWTELRDEVLGDAVVLAFRPAPPGGKQEEEQALFLVRARSGPTLEKLIARLNEVQKKSGDLEKLEERSHNDVKYFVRVERNKPAFYYFQRGPVLAASTQEEMLKRVIVLDRQAPAQGPLSRKLNEMQADGGLIGVWINPRAFDADLQQKAKTAEGSDAAFLKQFLVYWKALDDVAVFVNLRQSIEIGVTARARPSDLPAAAQKFLDAAAQPSELWSAFPEDSLLAVAGRVDFAAWSEVVVEFLTPEARKGLSDAVQKLPIGKLGNGVLPNLGPDFGYCLTAPSAQDKVWFPQLVAALRVQPGQGTVPLGQTIFDSLNFFANFAVFDFNNKNPQTKLEFRTSMQGKVEVRTFANGKLPPGLEPSYALKAGYLLFASSPDGIQRFAVSEIKSPPAEVPLLRASLQRWSSYLKERRDPVIQFLVAKYSMEKKDAETGLDGFLTGLQLFQSVEVTQRVKPGQTVLTLRLRTTEALRK